MHESISELLKRSVDIVDSLISRPAPPAEQVQAIFEKTEEERELGLMSSYFDRATLDRRFGKGRWVALPRFVV